MKTGRKWVSFSGAVAFLSAFLLAGCGSDGDSALSNGNPGLNDVNVVAAFGDSITQGWGGAWDGAPFNVAWKKHFGELKTINLGIGGDRIENILWRLDHGALDGASPKVIVLMIGVNNAPLVQANGVPATGAPVGGGAGAVVEGQVQDQGFVHSPSLCGHQAHSQQDDQSRFAHGETSFQLCLCQCAEDLWGSVADVVRATRRCRTRSTSIPSTSL